MAPKKKDTQAAEAVAAAEAEDKKRKAESTEEPAKKEAQVDAQESANVEHEKDDVDKRPAMGEKVCFDPSESTLNVLPMQGGKVLMPLSDGPIAFLVAGARANVGIKAGRYLFEARIVEYIGKGDSHKGGRAPSILAKVGFSTAGSSLFLGDDENSVSFDSDGHFMTGNKKPTQMPIHSQRFHRDNVVAIVLNLDPKSENANTISLFKDGVRVHQPQKLPDNLIGKTLFPHVNFRGVSLQVSFGPEPSQALPFKCKCIEAAPKENIQLQAPAAPKAAGGKYEVAFPVGLPNEGLFDWLDQFLLENPTHYELSDRKIAEWARKSGLHKQPRNNSHNSNDKPDLTFGDTSFGDLSVQRLLGSVSPLVPRNYVVAELKSNLLPAERAVMLKRFKLPHYRKVARVVVGEPLKPYKAKVHTALLKTKQDKANMEYRGKLALRERNKKIKEMKKAQAELTKKRVEEAKARAKELADKKAKEVADKKAKEDAEKKEAEGKEEKKEDEKEGEQKQENKEEASEEKKEDAEEKKEEGKKEEDTKEEEKKEEETKEDEEEEEEELKEPVAELTEEEKKTLHIPHATPDLTQAAMAAAFSKFALPAEDEGFDDIKYEWSNAKACAEHMKKWLVQNKMTIRLEDLKPSAAFKEQHTDIQKKFAEYQQAQKDFKAKGGKKVQKKEGEEEEDKEAAEADIYSVSNISDIGDGEPLFGAFNAEDWALVMLRCELSLLVRFFKDDANDPEHPGMHEKHLGFYYQKYFHKMLNYKMFGVDGNEGLLPLAKDVASIDKESGAMIAEFKEDMATVLEHCVKHTEEERRGRQRRVDAGDETAKLHFNLHLGANKPKGSVGNQGGKGWNNSKGAGKSYGKATPYHSGGGRSWV